MPTLFKTLAELGEKLEATKKRLLMIDLVSSFLQNLEADEIEPAVSMLLGRPFPKWSQRTLEVSWTTLHSVILRITGSDWNSFLKVFNETGDAGSATMAIFEKSKSKKQAVLFEKALTIAEVRRSFEAISETSGHGSRERKERQIAVLLSSASPLEAKYLVKIFIGETRTGFHEGLMEQAVAKAFQIPPELVQKAGMIIGDIGEVASIARTQGREALAHVKFRVFRPVDLMLAQMANDVAEALREHGGVSAFEYKYDGARVQIHKHKDEIKIFSRRLSEATGSLPEVVEEVKANIKAEEVILEGEVVAVDREGHPIPFQHLMRRFRRVHAVEDMAEEVPLKLYLFDILYLNGESLVSQPYTRRRQILAENAGEIPLTAMKTIDNVQEAEAFMKDALDAGHEGLMAKKPDSVYAVGVRGKRWLKIKPVLEPLDLVIVGAEQGYGRRFNWLSDYYLAARDSETGEFLTVGKTFKGLTDAEIIEMTRRLKEITVDEKPRRVNVIPKIVVEVAYNEIQKSPKYRCGMALRFARITRIRDDKTPEQADTIQRVREIYERQFLKKGRYTAG
ncbi:ATP-dependent DNA ligase [Candidatus Bathyarchaeota archaeon]|nr:ATP-dependent DNA ligase [Candidatus Bathyarchaeota archaeon]